MYIILLESHNYLQATSKSINLSYYVLYMIFSKDNIHMIFLKLKYTIFPPVCPRNLDPLYIDLLCKIGQDKTVWAMRQIVAVRIGATIYG